MAKNLQSKLLPSDSIRIFDINKDAVQKLAEEMSRSQAGGANVQVAESAFDASKEAVSFDPSGGYTLLHDEFNSFYIVLSMTRATLMAVHDSTPDSEALPTRRIAENDKTRISR
jgi:hypothetical protein